MLAGAKCDSGRVQARVEAGVQLHSQLRAAFGQTGTACTTNMAFAFLAMPLLHGMDDQCKHDSSLKVALSVKQTSSACVHMCKCHGNTIVYSAFVLFVIAVHMSGGPPWRAGIAAGSSCLGEAVP